MTPNELLLWLSARKDGSWPQFRGAVEALDLASTDGEEQDTPLPLHQRVRFNLERLGHVEFDVAECENGWRVVPPALALSQHDDETIGVLCGARTPKLLNRLAQAAGAISFEEAAQTDCPDIVRMRAREAKSLIEVAEREGILCQLDTPTALLSHVPSVDAMKGWRREPMPLAGKDWDVKQFVIEKKVMKWRPVTLQEANMHGAQGLFCFTRFQIPQYFLREARETSGAGGGWKILRSLPPSAASAEIRPQGAQPHSASYFPPAATDGAGVSSLLGFSPLLQCRAAAAQH